MIFDDHGKWGMVEQLVDLDPLLFNGVVGSAFTRLSSNELANVTAGGGMVPTFIIEDRKSTRLNSSHANISYAVFCLKKNIETKAKGYYTLTNTKPSTPDANTIFQAHTCAHMRMSPKLKNSSTHVSTRRICRKIGKAS